MRTARWSRPLALALLALSMGMVVFALASLVLPGAEALPDRPDPVTVLIASSVMLTYPVVGAIVVIRRPDNPLGWLFVVLGLGFTVTFFNPEYVARAQISEWPLPGMTLVAWIGDWAFALDMAIAFAWIPLLFPTGHLPAPRWRIVAWALAITMALGITATAVQPDPLDTPGGLLPNPLGIPALAGVTTTVETLYFPVIVILGLLCVSSLFLRYRHAGSVERQQIKWFLLATASFLATLILAFATLIEALFMIALVAAAGIPVAAAIAILRYRLWDIDRVVSRSIGWTLVTGVLLSVFAGAVIALQALLSGFTQGQTLAVAASTLVVFALFQPMRWRIQAAVDRRFNRARYDAERTTAAFATRVRDEVDLDTLRATLREVTAAAVEPVAAAVWLRRLASGSGR